MLIEAWDHSLDQQRGWACNDAHNTVLTTTRRNQIQETQSQDDLYQECVFLYLISGRIRRTASPAREKTDRCSNGVACTQARNADSTHTPHTPHTQQTADTADTRQAMTDNTHTRRQTRDKRQETADTTHRCPWRSRRRGTHSS
eukprot:54945-Rhodomonas_salina.1